MFVLVLRLFLAEGVNPQSTNLQLNLMGTFYKVAISALLALMFLGWFLANIRKPLFHYRKTFLVMPLLIFTFAAAFASIDAPDKRAAMTSSVTLIAPLLAAILLVQLLDTKRKTRATLAFLLLLAAVMAVYCTFQYFVMNEIMITQYQNNPSTFLNPLGITPGSFQQMLFEHSLMSRDVRGFFTTGNSAGSFLILTLFPTVALIIESARKIKVRRRGSVALTILLTTALALILTGLALTRSKGAIAAAILTALLFIAYCLLPRFIQKHKKPLLITTIILIIIAASAVITYGIKNDTLPGGNSMLVRWQYWKASARMFADHPINGAGPGNFANFYTHYKPPQALESISDPHNLLLNILTQYGPLGLLALTLAIIIPLAKLYKNGTDKQDSLLAMSLFCSLFAVLLHNLVDFAIFEPAIYTTFWFALACLVTLVRCENCRISWRPSPAFRVTALVGSVLIAVAYTAYAFLPPALAAMHIRTALKHRRHAHAYLLDAAKRDTLDPLPHYLNGRIYLDDYSSQPIKDQQNLNKAAAAFLLASSRDIADFKPWDKLTTTYQLLADHHDRRENLLRALDAAFEAVERYPGSARLHLQLASIADQLDAPEMALEHYQRAVEIENLYQKQFRQMYPDAQLFSRLGSAEYNHALTRIEQLSHQIEPSTENTPPQDTQ